MNIQSVLKKVSALRNLAAKAGTIHEAEAAAAQADALIQKHRLSEADVESASAEQPKEKPAEGDALVRTDTQIPRWRRSLAHVIASHYGCFMWTSGSRGTAHWAIRIVGRPSDVEVVRYMFAWISTEIDRLAQGETGKGDRSAFRLGAVIGIRNALAASTRATVADHGDTHPPTQSAAMILVGRGEESKKEADRIVGKFKNLPAARTSGSAAAFGRGRKAGEGMHVGKSLPGASRMLTR